MKFCYLDESGVGDEPYATLVGVIVDHTRMHKTKREWEEHLQKISELAGRKIDELHMNKFYRGNTPYNNIEGAKRAEIISESLKWFTERNHTLCISMIDKEKYKHNEEIRAKTYNSYWCLMAMHIILQLQKNHKNESNNKGKTLLVFDEKVKDKDRLRQILKDEQKWLDDYYSNGCLNQDTRLDQIVDYPYYGDSKDIGLIQMVDVIAYILRTYAEIFDNKRVKRYHDEDEKLQNWFSTLKPLFLQKSTMLPSRGSDCAKTIREFVPSFFLNQILN